MKSTVLIGTRKGFIAYEYKNETWELINSSFHGIPVSIAFADERNGTWWAALDHGHWGVKLHRSKDRGKSWEEIVAPAYTEGLEIKPGVKASTKYIWAMAHGGKDYPNRLWIGTDPGGLFKSEDGGDTWQLNESLWNHPTRPNGWFGGGRDNPGIHSIVVDPDDHDRIFIAISCAGVFESKDGGESWIIRNKGMKAEFLPNPDAETGYDPHILVAAPSNHEVLWQQNHCGIYRSVDGGHQWDEVDQKGGPAYFGFAIAVDEKNPDSAWVAPAIGDENRIAIDGALCICRTEDGGKTWKALRNGLPQENSYDLVYRHALAVSGNALIFGTTTGNLFFSNNRGDDWKVISNYLPMVHSVQFVD